VLKDVDLCGPNPMVYAQPIKPTYTSRPLKPSFFLFSNSAIYKILF